MVYTYMFMNGQSIDDGVQFLANAGLNLFAVFALDGLPAPVATAVANASPSPNPYQRLLLIGHGGPTLWRQLQANSPAATDPVDSYSIATTHQFIDRYLAGAASLILYPSNDQYLLPLSELGQLAGWSQPTPLGLGIHPSFGVWFAYRVALLTTAVLPTNAPVDPTGQPHACLSCTHKPCISACPAQAVQPDGFDIFACSRYRLQPKSACADRCLARMACPMAPEQRYTLAQIQYHYQHSLETIRAYYTDSSTGNHFER